MFDTNSDERYNEEVSIHPIFGVLIISIIGLLIYLSVNIQVDIPQKLLAFIILLLVFIYSNFMKLQISITSTLLTVGFGLFKYSIRLDNIESVETRNPHWYWYGGLGIRFGWDFSIAYIQNYRKGVMVTPIRGRKLFFSTNNPEKVVSIVEELLKNQGIY